MGARRAKARHLANRVSGVDAAEALGLYARCGYARCGRFGTYADDPLSVFMHKALPAVPAA